MKKILLLIILVGFGLGAFLVLVRWMSHRGIDPSNNDWVYVAFMVLVGMPAITILVLTLDAAFSFLRNFKDREPKE